MNTSKASYVVNATTRDGKHYRITVEVDLHKLAREYGQRARLTKGGRIRLAYGMVKVAAQDLPATFVETSALPHETI